MSLIWSEKEVLKFLESVVPKLERDEVILMLLAARKKYYPKLKRSEEILDRKIIRTDNPKIILQKLKRFTEGVFYQDDEIIPEEALVPYIILNPKSTIKAYNAFTKEVNDQIFNLIKTIQNNPDKVDYNFFRKLDLKLFSAIHRSTSRHLYWLVDIDEKDEDKLNLVVDKLGEDVVWITETKNGFHVIVKVSSNSGKVLFTELKGKEGIEIQREVMTPICGCKQGGFKVKEFRR